MEESPTVGQSEKSKDLVNYSTENWDAILCSRDISELLVKYEGYIPLWDIRAPHFVDGVRSQLRPAGWRKMLSGGPN